MPRSADRLGRILRGVLLIGLLFAVASCSKTTVAGVLLDFETDGTLDPDTLHVTITANGKTPLDWCYPITNPATFFPTTLAIAPSGEPTEMVFVTASVLRAGVTLDVRENYLTEVPNDRVVEYDILFTAKCSAQVSSVVGPPHGTNCPYPVAASLCPTGETCSPATGMCVSNAVVSSTLPQPGGENRVDAGAGASCQSGTCVCLSGETLCGGACANEQTDRGNCGACGTTCPTGGNCESGTCVCPSGGVTCGMVCADQQTDVDNCGACGTTCLRGGTCQSGACGCPIGDSVCGNACVNEQTDVNNCGACGTICSNETTCQVGSCIPCPAGRTACNGSCVDEQTDPKNCGVCGTLCAVGGTCQSGTCVCGMTCPTGASCQSGACVCPSGESVCGQTCVNEQTDPNNCGTCGKSCGIDGSCQSGTCVCPNGGHCLFELASGQSPASIAVAGSDVYWTVRCTMPFLPCGLALMKIPVVGGTPVMLAEGTLAPWPTNIALDGTNAYWTGYTGYILKVPLVRTMTMTMSIDMDPGAVLTTSPGMYPDSIAVDATSVYWVDNDGRTSTVMKVPLGGGVVTTLASGFGTRSSLDGSANESYPTGIAADATSVYWTASGNGAVMKVAVDGTDMTTLVLGQKGPVGIAVDAASVYWTAWDDGTVMKAALDGSHVMTLASGQRSPVGIAIDAASVYWTNAGDGTVKKVPLGGGIVTTLATGQTPAPDTVSGIAVDATSVYWTNVGTLPDLDRGPENGSVMKLTPK